MALTKTINPRQMCKMLCKWYSKHHALGPGAKKISFQPRVQEKLRNGNNSAESQKMSGI